MSDAVTAQDWIKGIALSIAASIIGGASKLAIRRSWLLEQDLDPLVAVSSPGSASEEGCWTENVPRSTSSYNHLSQSGRASGDGSSDEVGSTAVRGRFLLALTLRISGMLGMTFLNPLCCVLAMNYASPSILAPFSGLTLVWIILFSNPVIGETPSSSQVIAAIFIVLGEVIVAIFGDHTNDGDVTIEALERSYCDPFFILYVLGMALWMIMLGYIVKLGQQPTLKRFAWGAIGGSITGMQNFLKDSLTVLKASKEGSHPWYLYLMVLLAITTAFCGLLLLTACMKRYDATYSSAMFVGSFVISASIMSAIHYKTFSSLETVWNFILYPLGLAVLMGGVVLLVFDAGEVTIVVNDGDAASNDNSTGRRVELKEPLVQESRNSCEPSNVAGQERIQLDTISRS